MFTAWKQPAEKRAFDYDFSPLIGANTITTILSVTAVAREGTSVLTNAGQTISGKIVQVVWSGGADGVAYHTTVRVRDSALQEHEIDGEITVADLGFVLPKGITSTYLTAEEYVARFGIQETVSLTDERGGETVGQALGKALSDAAARIEAYLANRHALPLATTPEVLKAIAADLARERLFTNHPTEEVTRRADQARKDLRDIGSGALVLVVGNAVVTSDVNDQPAVYSPITVFSDALLGSYRGRLQ